jgi:hypothetical protein
MRIIARIEVPGSQSGNGKTVGEEEKIETLRTDKSQATIANFLRKSEG